jgi:dTDP-4-dehydrorhamnose reductase
MSKKKVLITGANGNLGQDLCEVFTLAGFEVVATDRSDLDITNQVEVKEKISTVRPDFIINAAAYNLVDKIEDPAVYPLALAVNVEGPKNLAEVAKYYGIPIVHFSTDYVFAGYKPEGYKEDDQPNPLSKYGQTKYLGELAVEQAGGQWYVCRLSKIFGRPGCGETTKPSFVSLMLKLAAEKPALKIVDEEIGCPSYTRDIAEATLRLIKENFPSGIYHFVNSGPGVTWYQFAEEIFSTLNIQTPRQPVSAEEFGVQPAKRPKFAALLNTKFPPLRSRAEALQDFLTLPKISLILVSTKVKDILKENLLGLFNSSCKYPFEVIVVDNGSNDGTAQMVLEEFSQVHFIQNDWNSGFAHACNQGLKVAKGEVFVLLNPDTQVKAEVLENVFTTITQRQEIGVMGIKLLNKATSTSSGQDGSVMPSVRRDPSFVDQLAILLKLPHVFSKITDRYLATDFDYQVSQEVEQVRGSFFAFRRDIWRRVGFLDEENFFVWFEEVDFCRRVRQAGYKIWYNAEVSCVDLVGQTFKQMSVRKKQAMFSRSLARYFFKWHTWWQGAIITILRPVVICLGALVDLWRR